MEAIGGEEPDAQYELCCNVHIMVSLRLNKIETGKIENIKIIIKKKYREFFSRLLSILKIYDER